MIFDYERVLNMFVIIRELFNCSMVIFCSFCFENKVFLKLRITQIGIGVFLEFLFFKKKERKKPMKTKFFR